MISGFIGVVHIPPMPGDPMAEAATTFQSVERFALDDARALAEGDVDGIIIENFGSAPFSKGTNETRIPPHQIAMMSAITHQLVHSLNIPIGVNCLRNDVISALGIAAATGASFVRVNVHTSAYVTDQGLIEGEAHRSLRYRKSLGAEGVEILADVLVKHAEPLVPVDPTSATEDTVKRGLADGVIVTGRATGDPISLELLREVRAAASPKPVLIGSGLNLDNAAELAAHADGAIVGSSLKKNGELNAPVDTNRVRAMADVLHKVWVNQN